MLAAIYNSYGDESVLQLAEVEKPKVDKNTVLVRIKATSVNPIDIKIRRGDFKLLSGRKFPKIPGADFSGIVEESNNENFKSGDNVFGMVPYLQGGASAQYLVAKPNEIAHMPTNLTHEQAAALPLVSLTAVQALVHIAWLQKGMRVLVNGASGGVGTIALQLVKHYNAEPTAVAGKRNEQFCLDLGATHFIDYKNFRLADNDKYDIIFDCVGNFNFKQMANNLTSRGTLITTNPSAQVYLLGSLLKFYSGRKYRAVMVSPDADDLKQLSVAATDGVIKPIIEQTFELAQIADAHRLSANGHVTGKIVVTI